ncbi:glycosyltransferase [Pedobacter sp. UBA4863]|uniref:glycosyltransferase family 2 protein n=1 Tax=Pedobacter sp. UBA4863 TaxID=1947060 RepID=UPI0025DE2222|nr:glycosyltransferase [Pedobacter sp. UBA4863]
MAFPLVSVIIPLYNAEKYISETIESVLNQTYQNIEIIIIDDGSTDNSLALAKSYENSKIKVFSQDNKGVSSARNFGISIAKGDYIQFLDADDLIAPSKIELQIEYFISNPLATFVCSKWMRFKNINKPNNSNLTKILTPKIENLPINFIATSNFIPLMCGLIKRTTIAKTNGFDKKMTHIEDVNFLIRLYKADQNFHYLETEFPLFFYRNSPNSASKTNQYAFLSGVFTNAKTISTEFYLVKHDFLLENYWNVFLNAIKLNYSELVNKSHQELKRYRIDERKEFKFKIYKAIGCLTFSKTYYIFQAIKSLLNK